MIRQNWLAPRSLCALSLVLGVVAAPHQAMAVIGSLFVIRNICLDSCLRTICGDVEQARGLLHA